MRVEDLRFRGLGFRATGNTTLLFLTMLHDFSFRIVESVS